jgi:hypothetical protein
VVARDRSEDPAVLSQTGFDVDVNFDGDSDVEVDATIDGPFMPEEFID